MMLRQFTEQPYLGKLKQAKEVMNLNLLKEKEFLEQRWMDIMIKLELILQISSLASEKRGFTKKNQISDY